MYVKIPYRDGEEKYKLNKEICTRILYRKEEDPTQNLGEKEEMQQKVFPDSDLFITKSP